MTTDQTTAVHRPLDPHTAPANAADGEVENYALPHRVLGRPVQCANVADETYQQLLMAIKFGFIRAGERLPPERALKEQMTVSRSTLRKALQNLRLDGYIDARSGRAGGTFVVYEPRPTTKEEAAALVKRLGARLFDALDLRSAVEPAAAGFAAERATDMEIANLRAIQAAEKKTAKKRRREFDVGFHLAIAEMARAPALSDAIYSVEFQLFDIIGYVPMLDVTMLKSRRQHDSIVDAIAARDPEGAGNAMTEHLGVTSTVIRGFATDVLDLPLTAETHMGFDRSWLLPGVVVRAEEFQSSTSRNT